VGVQVFFHALLTQRARACVVVVCVSVVQAMGHVGVAALLESAERARDSAALE
jgi:hypothetical protein